MAKFRIVTFDGGGIRGALTASLVKRINDVFPNFIQKTDMFAGTSTGAFIALGLASGLEPQDLVDLYSVKNGRYIFNPRYCDLYRPKYNNRHLKKLLKDIFGTELRIKDLDRYVLVPSFRVKGYGSTLFWSPVVFNNFSGSGTTETTVIDVALSSSAAPTYFPSYKECIDGGVIANNPSLAAISAATDRYLGGQNIEDIYLLSIGTGLNCYKINYHTAGWGKLHWLLCPSPPAPIITVIMDGVSDAYALFSHQMLGYRYKRLNPSLSKPIGLDDYNKIPVLVELAHNYDLGPTVAWLKNNWLD